MQHCEFCGSDQPIDAYFCGNCGRALSGRIADATAITKPSEQDLRTSDTPHFPEREDEETDAVLPDMLLPELLVEQGQMPYANQVPTIQGTPQLGGVPTVQGTPSIPGNPPPSEPGIAHGVASSAPSHAPTWEPHVPDHQQPVQYPQPASPPHHHPVQHPQPESPPQPAHHPEQHPKPEPSPHHHHHYTAPLHARRSHARQLHGSTAGATTKIAVGATTKLLVVALAIAVVVAGSSILLVRALVPTNSPGLSFTGSSSVAAGGILHVHGQGFIPNGSVTLTIDTARSANSAGLSQMFIARIFQPQSATDANIKISASGTFDADVLVPSNLPPGVYSIHAIENSGSLNVSRSFTVVQNQQNQAKLTVSPQSLDFGQVPANQQASQPLSIVNLGELPLTWQADVGGTSWLTLDTSSGTVQPGTTSQTIHVLVNTTSLTAGSYTGTVNINSNGGSAEIGITLIVMGVTPTPSPTPTPASIPTPTPTSVPTTSTIKILGGVTNLRGYCQSIGNSSESLDGSTAYDWHCVTPGGQHVSLSFTAACRWQYNDSQAEDRMADYFNPYSWECWG